MKTKFTAFTLGLLLSGFIATSIQAAPPEDAALIKGRAVEAVIWGMPAVNYDLMLQEMLTKTEAKVGQVVYWGRPLDWHNQTLTPNPDALYFMAFFNTQDGPVVLDLPPGDADGSFNANIVTIWQMPLEDAGLLGVDKGAGAKYVILPPGYTNPVPEGFIPLRSDTFGGYMLFRANFKSHSEADVAKAIAYGKQMKIYPLAQASNPPATIFTDAQNVDFDSTIKYDASYFEHLNQIVQSEPWLQRDRIMIEDLKSLGIEKGKPFNPDIKMTKLLKSAALAAHAYLENMYNQGWASFFDRKQWRVAAPAEVVKTQSSAYADLNAYPMDQRGMTYTYGFVGIKHLGVGQMYLITIHDQAGKALDGSKTYRLQVPPHAPVQQYWSVTVYDRQTHALVKHMTRASRSSQIPELQKNADGSVDIYFGPHAPAGKENNWVPTDPKREFELMFRLYAPTKALFDKTWALPDVEQVK